MKKLVTALFTAVILAAALAITAFSAYYSTDVGDANGDGDIDAKDLLLVRRYMAGLTEDTYYVDTDAADVNADGSIDSKDLLYIKRHMAALCDITSEFGHVNSGYRVSRMTLCGREICDYKILIPSDANDCILTFSEKMSWYLENLTGYKLERVTYDDGSPMIEIKPDIENEYLLGDEGYIIRTEDQRVTIIGGVKRGCMYGILDFLKEYCAVDFRQDKTLYGKWLRVAVESGIYDCFIPQLEYRCVRVGGYSNSNNLEYYVIPNKTNAIETSSYLASSRYGNALGRTYANAHSFETLISSCDAMHQPCLTDKAICDECTTSVLALIEQRQSWGYVIGEEMNQISCSLNDNTDYCICSNCKALAQKEGSLAGPLIAFVNRVASEVEDEFPGIDLFTIAYYDFRIPPANISPARNVVICYCWNGCNNHTFGSGECTDPSHYDVGYNNSDEERNFLGWADKTDRLYVWYYVTGFIYPMAPSPNVFNIFDDIKWLYHNGAVGVFTEGGSGCTFEGLKGFLSAKTEENPDITYEQFIDEMKWYLEGEYGDGYEYIFRYIEMQTEAGDGVGCFVNNYEWPFDTYSRTYMAEHYYEMEELFDNAFAMAKTESQKKAIRRASLHMYFLCLSARYDRYYVKGSAEERSAYERDYKNKLYKYMKDYGGVVGSVGKIPSTNAITDNPMEMWYGLGSGSRGAR